jgi:hypothetical protein
LAVLAVVISGHAATEVEFRGREFLAVTRFKDFTETHGSSPQEIVLTSPVIHSRINFNEVIVSWNANLQRDSSLVVEARAVYPERTTSYYNLGSWSLDPAQHPRKSLADQKDSDGDVATDTLVLSRPATDLQIRFTLQDADSSQAGLRFCGVSLADNKCIQETLPPLKKAWGKLIPVQERTQMIYPNGKTLCSPTTVSMMLSHWAETLKKPELDKPVPEIVEAIYDSQWQGTGNWCFNMAYAGSLPGMRAYVARLSDVSELEAWIAQGIPVGLSLDYDRLRAKGPGPNGHLVVLVGFTEQGDPIINDPGTTEHVRKTFSRKKLIDAWACSRNTVYLIYPENLNVPEDIFGHWDSPHARRWNQP